MRLLIAPMPDPPTQPRAKTSFAADRQARLAEALRDNLRRRKAQARDRADSRASDDTPDRDQARNKPPDKAPRGPPA